MWVWGGQRVQFACSFLDLDLAAVQFLGFFFLIFSLFFFFTVVQLFFPKHSLVMGEEVRSIKTGERRDFEIHLAVN